MMKTIWGRGSAPMMMLYDGGAGSPSSIIRESRAVLRRKVRKTARVVLHVKRRTGGAKR